MGCYCCCECFEFGEDERAVYVVLVDPSSSENRFHVAGLHFERSVPGASGEARMTESFTDSSSRLFRIMVIPASWPAPPCCPHCHCLIEPSFFDAHVQQCGSVNQSTVAVKEVGGMFAQMVADEKVSDGESLSVEDLCAVCMSRRRVCALLPCGHVVVCFSCSQRIQQTCPMCRSQFKCISRVYTKGTANPQSELRCKHCHKFILPSLFSGHQETCGMRMMIEKREEEENAKAKARLLSDDNPTGVTDIPPEIVAAVTAEAIKARDANAATHSSTELSKEDAEAEELRCLECGSFVTNDVHLVVCIPCGHSVICEICAKTRTTTCPLCCTTIVSYNSLFRT